MNEDIFLQRLFDLPPVRRALQDPHYKLVRRPVDCRWADARLASRITGFQPHLHEFYYSSKSQLAAYLDHERDALNVQVLAMEALALAHDYLHSWAYRFLDGVDPALTDPKFDTSTDVERHSFLLVLTECVAVGGLDYWYLCNSPASARCCVDGDFGGPLTVNYRERLLPVYRQADPTLTVQAPEFFSRLLSLYAEGRFDGVDEQDLFNNQALADWLIRELLISPRQRILARRWTAHRAGLPGMTFPDEGAPFQRWIQCSKPAVKRLSQALWDAMAGRDAPLPPRESWAAAVARTPAQSGTDARPDFRFVHWRLAPHGLSSSDLSPESWSAYVDQVIGCHEWSDQPDRIAAVAAALPELRAQGSSKALLALLEPFKPLEGDDRAPDHFIIVN